MASFKTLDDLDPKGKRVLVRLDLNLPIQDDKITDLTRLERSLRTLKDLTSRGAKVITLAHLGRPEGRDPSLSLRLIADALKEAMAPTPVFFCDAPQGPQVKESIKHLREGEILLLENVRFVEGEEKNDPTFARELASWGEAYVNDAFSAAHRAHASTEGIAHLLPAYAGRLMEEELNALTSALHNPKRPLMAIVGGAKVSSKISVLTHLLPKVDYLVIGGAMANTFLAAQGYEVGESLWEPDQVDVAKKLLKESSKIILPVDCVTSETLAPNSHTAIRQASQIRPTDKIFDIGPETVAFICEKMKSCHTLLWNGPVGVFEIPPFDAGTSALANAAAHLTQSGTLKSVAGGGETVAALNQAGVLDKFSYVSTAGGAFLEWLEGKELPGVKALQS